MWFFEPYFDSKAIRRTSQEMRCAPNGIVTAGLGMEPSGVQLAGATGLEPATSCVTGRRSIAGIRGAEKQQRVSAHPVDFQRLRTTNRPALHVLGGFHAAGELTSKQKASRPRCLRIQVSRTLG